MLKRLSHVAIVVPDLGAASERYRMLFGARLSSPQALPEHGVTVVFVDLGETKVELIEPLGDASPVASFLAKHPAGGMHHLCYQVDDIHAACTQVRSAGGRIVGDGEPKIGAHGKPVVFVHPADAFGTLVELEEA